MPRLRRRSLSRREFSDPEIRTLVSGYPFFCDDRWPCISRWPIDDRHNWPGPAVLAEWRACWEAHKSDIEARAAEKGLPSFGKLVFVDARNPAEAMTELSRIKYGETDEA